MIEILKDLLNMDEFDDSKNNILEFYLTRATNSIQFYLNYSTKDMENGFEAEIVDLAKFYYQNKDKTGKIQMSQGSRSETIERGLPRHIKDSLPLPRVRVVG